MSESSRLAQYAARPVCSLYSKRLVLLHLGSCFCCAQVMAINESSRLLKSLEAEDMPAKRLVVDQILPASNSDCKFCNIKRKVRSYQLRS